MTDRTKTGDDAMVERVARAIGLRRHGFTPPCIFDRELAKAALEASHHAELVEALERIAEYADEPTEQPQDRLDFIEEELEAETTRTPYGEDEEPPCRNGWEVSELLMERAGLIAQITLTKIGGAA